MNLYFRTIFRPKQSFESLLNKSNYFQLSFLYILIPIVGYTLLYIFLTIAHGAPSAFTPWLNIPKENYYAANRFILAPSMLLCWLVAAAFVQITGKLSGSKGTFEQTMAVLALSISMAMWGSLIHDLPMSFLSAVGIIDAKQHEIAMNSPTIFRTLLWVAYSIYTLAFLILFSISVRTVHKLSVIKSIVTGFVAFAIFQGLFFVFNR